MMSLKESEFSSPPPRAVPAWARIGDHPVEAMADLLRRHQSEILRSHNMVVAAQRETAELTAELTVALSRRPSSTVELRILWDILTAHGVESTTHVGTEISKIEEDIDVIDWVDPSAGQTPGCVAEAFAPEVRWHGTIVHRAQVTGVLPAVEEASVEAEIPDEVPAPDDRGGAGSADCVGESDVGAGGVDGVGEIDRDTSRNDTEVLTRWQRIVRSVRAWFAPTPDARAQAPEFRDDPDPEHPTETSASYEPDIVTEGKGEGHEDK